MTEITTVKAEKEDLELHVELCAQRYTFLESKVEALTAKVDSLRDVIQGYKTSLSSVIIGAAGTVVTAIIGLIATIIMKF
jgi:chromosome segregation ATPase